MKTIYMLCVLLLGILSIDIYAQIQLDKAEIIVYTRVNNNIKTFIFQNNGVITSDYSIDSEDCATISPNGRYIALSSQNENTLKIIHFPSKKIVFNTNWQSNWMPCSLAWISNGVFFINGSNGLGHYFSFENSTLTEISSLDIVPTYPSLPNYFPTSAQNLLLQSSMSSNIYLYERCPTGKLLEGVYCRGSNTEMVIYNLSNNQEITILEHASPDYMRGYQADTRSFNNRQFLSAPLASWSPNGQYLAYFDWQPSTGSNIPHEGRIIIYNVGTNTYLNDADKLHLHNINRPLLWSSDNILVIWRTGIFSDIYTYEFHGSLTYFTFVNPATEVYVSADELFDTLSNYITFAPDGRAIIFIGKERITPEQIPDFGANPRRGDMVMISTITGEHTVIDTDVTEIITWRSICDFTVSDTASLISTMQSEPYSVICLDENGQYDLTASLPDVFGDITLIGDGAQIVMTGGSRIFNVTATGGLHLKNVSLSGGVADEGGAIYNAGELTLDDVILQNHSAVRGGAIYNVGNLIMNGGAIQNNTATEFGGGIYNIGDMQLDGVNIRDNVAPEGSGVYQGG